MKNKFTIGQMAKLHNIPVKTLRYYDEIDLFKPIEVNPDNGYRYYSIEQFKLLDIINYLKMLGIPLSEIKRQTSNRNLDEFIHILHRYKQETEQKINDLQMAKSKMEERINEMESIRQIETIGVPLVKTIKERKILQLKNQISTVYDLELSLRKLNEHVNFLASIFIGKVGLTISDNQLQNDDHLFDYNSIFMILEKVEKTKFVEEMELVCTLPKGKYASIYFRGGHHEAKIYVKKLRKYIEKENYEIK